MYGLAGWLKSRFGDGISEGKIFPCKVSSKNLSIISGWKFHGGFLFRCYRRRYIPKVERGKEIMILLTAGMIAVILLAAGLVLLFAVIGLCRVRIFQTDAEQDSRWPV